MTEPPAGVSELVRRLYAGVIETPPWEGFLHGIRREMDCKATLIMLMPPGSAVVNLISVVGGQSEVTSAYRGQLFALDPFVNLPEGRVITLHEFVGACELEQNEYYNNFMRGVWGVGFVLGFDVRTAAGYTAGLRLCRGIESLNFDAAAHHLVNELVPHLRQAIEIFDRVHHLQVEEIELSDALDRLGVAGFLLDVTGRVTQSNRTAAALLACAAGVTIRHGRLVLGSEDAQRQLGEVLARARKTADAPAGEPSHVPEVITIRREPGSPSLAVAARILSSPADLRSDHAPVVALYVSRPEQGSTLSPAVIRQLLGVTPAEAQLAACLANGATINQAAQELGVTLATARTQLYSIFRKTGMHRQSELVSVIAQTSARLLQQ